KVATTPSAPRPTLAILASMNAAIGNGNGKLSCRSACRYLRPGQLDAVLLQAALKVLKKLGCITHAPRQLLAVQAERRQCPGGFADVPFDRVKAVAAVGDMRDAQVLARGQQI